MENAPCFLVPSLTGCLLVASLLSSCTNVPGPMAFPVAETPQAETPSAATLNVEQQKLPGRVQYGVASWYGKGFHGRPTASGEIYNMHAITAAHRTVPLGTEALVTNMDNGQTIRVRINDRGPYIRGRVLDLSYGAARQIDMVRVGATRVKIEFLDRRTVEAPARARSVAMVARPVITTWKPLGPANPDLTLQAYAVEAGVYRDRAQAARAKERLVAVHPSVWMGTIAGDEPMIHRVRLGPFQQRKEAEQVAFTVQAQGYTPLVVPLEQ